MPFGAEVSLSVSASGSDLQYQWMKDEEVITDDSLPNCVGLQCPNLRITCLTPEHDGQYICTISSGDYRVRSHSAQIIGNNMF